MFSLFVIIFTGLIATTDNTKVEAVRKLPASGSRLGGDKIVYYLYDLLGSYFIYKVQILKENLTAPCVIKKETIYFYHYVPSFGERSEEDV